MNAPHHEHLLLKKCPNCGALAHEEDAGFCHFCDAELLVDVPPPAPPPPVPPVWSPAPPQGPGYTVPQSPGKGYMLWLTIIVGIIIAASVGGVFNSQHPSTRTTQTTVTIATTEAPTPTEPIFKAPTTTDAPEPTTTEAPTTTAPRPPTTPPIATVPEARFSGAFSGQATSSKLTLVGVPDHCSTKVSGLSEIVLNAEVNGAKVNVDQSIKGVHDGAGTYTMAAGSLTVIVHGTTGSIYQWVPTTSIILTVTDSGNISLDFTGLQDAFSKQSLSGHISNGC